MQHEIARHCFAWSPDRMNFREYLRLSSVRYFKAFKALIAASGTSVCDVGGFWGVWPITLKKFGFDVAMTETLRFYGDSFDPLFAEIRGRGIEIYDFDPFEPDSRLPRDFDFVSLMAIIEHYPHSLRNLAENVKRLISPEGSIFFEVPNIAYWPKRVSLLFGKSPLVELADVYRSEIPFIGHHHEFTIDEMRDLARLAGLRIVGEEFYNYSTTGRNKMKLFVVHPVLSTATTLIKQTRECIAVVCQHPPSST